MADDANYRHFECGQAWTASRCLRLIRPIQSRIALLQKFRDDARHESESGRRRMLAETHAQTGESRHDCRKRPRDDGNIHVQPRKSVKRAKQTYSRKNGPRGQQQPQRQQQHIYQQQPQWDDVGEEDIASESQPPRTPITTTKSRKLLSDYPRLFSKSPVAGRVELETPWLRRMMPPPQCHLSDVSSNNDSRPVPTTRLDPISSLPCPPDIRELRDKISSSQYRVYEAIGAWLHGLLRQTQGAVGIKTLLTMTLKRLPTHLRKLDIIEKQEGLRQELGAMYDQTPPSIRIYHEMELFAGSKRGRLLCVFVRAHGIAIIDQAIVEGLLRLEFADVLAQFCIDAGAVEEGMGLLQTIIQAQRPVGPSGAHCALGQEGGQRALKSLVTPMATTASPTCATLGSRWLQSQSMAIPCSTLSALLNGGYLAAEWLCTRDFTTGVWRTAILGMASSPSTARFARDFGITALCLLTSRLQCPVAAKDEMHRAMSKTVTSILAILYAMAQPCDGPLGVDDSIAGGLVRILADTAIAAATPVQYQLLGRYMIAIVLFILSHQKQGQRQHAGVSALPSWRDLEQFAASEIISCIQKEQGGATDKAMTTCQAAENNPQSTSGGTDNPYWTAVGLVSSMAHVCKRLSSRATHIYVSDMSQPLVELYLESGMKPFRRLRFDCAFFVANLTNDTRDLAFAESLVNEFGSSEQGNSPRIASQWRWEEGMNEWVVISPTAPKQTRARGRPRRNERHTY